MRRKTERINRPRPLSRRKTRPALPSRVSTESLGGRDDSPQAEQNRANRRVELRAHRGGSDWLGPLVPVNDPSPQPRYLGDNMTQPDHASAVPGVLAQMDRHAERIRLAMIGAAMVEGLLLVVALVKIDWRNDTQILLFVF